MRSGVATFVLSALLVCACGGGGGSSPGPCTAPGQLRALAVQGETAPGTAGTFLGFATSTLLDVASGGWAVFAASTTDPVADRVLYAAQPDGTLVAVFRAGDTVPDASGGTIDEFEAARVNAGGRVLALVTITGDGGGRDFGLLTARVASGGVSDVHDVIYDGRDLASTGLGGTLALVQASSVRLTNDDAVYFAGTTTGSQAGFWRAAADGTGLRLLVGTTSPLPGGLAVADFASTEVHDSGSRFAFVAERSDPMGTVGVYGGPTATGLVGLLLAEGDAVSGATIGQIPMNQPLVPYEAGSVLVAAESTLGEDHLLLAAAGLPALPLAVQGDPVPSTGGTYGALGWLQNEAQATSPMFRASIAGGMAGVTFALFGVVDTSGGTALALFNGRAAPADVGAGVTFTSTLPDLGTPGRTDVSRNGGLAFASVLSNGQTGVFWLIPDCGLFTLALSGRAAGTDTFANLTAWTVTTADGVVLFRAPLVTAGSGIFRRGP